MRNSHTSAADWRAAADFLADAATLQSLPELDDMAPARLRRLLSADLVVWERFNSNLQHLAFRLDPQPERDIGSLHAAFTHHFSEHPGFPYFSEGFKRGVVFMMSDFASTRTFLQTGLWREVYIHLRGKHQLGFGGPLQPGVLQTLSANRLSRDFGPRERELAKFIRPQLHAITRRIAHRHRANRLAGALSEFLRGSAAYALVAADGSLLEASSSGRAILDELPAAAAAGSVPDLTQTLRTLVAQAPAPAAARGLTLGCANLPSQRIALLLRLGEGQPAIVIFQSGAASAGPRLTCREQDVLALLTEGHDNRAIGAALQLSPRTVEKHCTTLFAKLGVESRVAAALFPREGLFVS